MHAKRRILIVDDEPDFTAMTAMALEGTGKYTVRQENSATNALAAAREFRPHVILLDIMMPEKDGGDVMAELEAHEETRNIPVIYLTALVSSSESPIGTLDRGGRHFLPKPTSLGTLAGTIEQLLAHQGQARQEASDKARPSGSPSHSSG